MSIEKGIQIQSFTHFWEFITPEERIITDVLRHIILQLNTVLLKEKLAYNVPFYYGKRRVCFIWPASVPRGGFKSGVMIGFCYGNKLLDIYNYLHQGTNKQVFYKIIYSPEEINETAIVSLLHEAIVLDLQFK